jgi:PII-like signaling protein
MRRKTDRAEEETMETPHDAVLLRIFTSVADKSGMQPLYIAIVEKARALHLAGATVLRGPMGFGHTAHMHKVHALPLKQDLPVIIEIVDTEDKIDAFLPVLDEMMESGLVTLEKAKVLQYGRHRAGMLERIKNRILHHQPASAGKEA